MAYDEDLAERVRNIVSSMNGTAELSMFGGLAFMLDGHMFVGVLKEDLMVRVGPDAYDGALERPGARIMDFTGKPMKGYVLVDKTGTANGRSLEKWIRMGSEFASTLPPKKAKPRK